MPVGCLGSMRSVSPTQLLCVRELRLGQDREELGTLTWELEWLGLSCASPSFCTAGYSYGDVLLEFEGQGLERSRLSGREPVPFLACHSAAQTPPTFKHPTSVSSFIHSFNNCCTASWSQVLLQGLGLQQ